ncbi:sensor histidine kinase [Microtetraspora fusca]|uniref:sensor histidine kinase n=1 Tax=Microtetraspora fusca TaxID=1997 RepID=UPI000A076808|nr:sensor histidine kinase [Microtetraspora fusca]
MSTAWRRNRRSLAEGVAAPSGDGEPGAGHAWKAFRGWETLYSVVLAVTIALVFADHDLTPAARTVALALLGCCAAGYLLLGRPALGDGGARDRRGLLYVGVMIATFVPATIITTSATMGLFALCPQAFMLLRDRYAVAVLLALNAGPVTMFLAAYGTTGHLGFVSIVLIGIAFAAVLGSWISRIITQSTERARLIEELSASRAEVARLSAERGALAERERLAREIHDTLAQGFTSIIMLIQAAEAQPGPAPGSRHLALAVQTARENLAEARALVAALGPAPLDGSTLDEALRRLTARLGEELGLQASFAVEGVSRALPANTEVVLVRAAQEALANVRKHAAASAVQVRLVYGVAEVTLTVRDDGCGLGPGPTSGYGLRAMRSRVEQEGGALTVTGSMTDAIPAADAATRPGTTLTVTLPSPAPPPDSRDGE